jgi:uncharacterized membrane protein
MNESLRPSPQGHARPGELEQVVSTLLRTGLGVSLGTVTIGLAMLFARHPGDLLSHARFTALTARDAGFPHRLSSLVTGVAHGDGQAIIAAGLVLLILTPVLRVAISMIEFIRARDRAFALVTAGVLAVLLFSLLLRAGGG